MNNLSNAPLWTLLLAGGLLSGNAYAASSKTGSSSSAESASSKKKSGSGQIRFLPGSAETVKERSSRLKRECKGQVNAGACTGYTG